MNERDSHREGLNDILDLSIELENAVGELYEFFSHHFSEDQPFWWGLAMEEDNHAALLESIQGYFRPEDILPPGSLTGNSEMLQALLTRVVSLTSRFKESPPTRFEAFWTALQLEHSAGEQHFQMAVEAARDYPGSEVIRRLVNDDRNHAQRIETYMSDAGVAPES